MEILDVNKTDLDKISTCLVLFSTRKTSHKLLVWLGDMKGYQSLERILLGVASRTKKIEENSRKLQRLYTQDDMQPEIFLTAKRDFEVILNDLLTIRERLMSHSMTRTFLSSPVTVEQLSDIALRLKKTDHLIEILGLIGVLNYSQRTTSTHFTSLLTELNVKSPDLVLVKSRVGRFCQMIMIQDSVQDITQRRKGCRFEQIPGYTNLTAGVGMYEDMFGVRNYEMIARELRAAAKNGWSDAYYYLGMLFKNGQGVERCDITAKNFFQLGTDARVAAAVSELGNCYEEGIGVEQCPIESVKFVKQGAEMGDPYGLAVYSYYKLHGKNTDTNFSLAYQMSKKAAAKGRGKDLLALCYERGIGVERDALQAFKLYSESAANKKDWFSCLYLAKCYEQGIGIEMDLGKAANFYKRGTKFIAYQRPYYQPYYGLCLIRGRGVRENKKKGWAEVQKSIEVDNAIGWYVKGECYRFGYGVEVAPIEAVKCYQRALEMENGEEGKTKAKFALGCMYESGDGGLPRDVNAAFEHYNYAANRMHQEAQWKVALWCESGTGVNRFEERAVYYFKLAANSGHREAQLKYSKYYMKGIGVPRDLLTTIQVLRPAAEYGHSHAKRLIRRAQRQIFLRRQLPLRTNSVPPRMGS